MYRGENGDIKLFFPEIQLRPRLTITMDRDSGQRQRNSCLTFWADFRALFIKMFRLATRRVGQTIAEFILSCVFLGLVLGLRYVFDRNYYPAYRLSRFRPQDTMTFNQSAANITYYYPGKSYLAMKITTLASH